VYYLISKYLVINSSCNDESKIVLIEKRDILNCLITEVRFGDRKIVRRGRNRNIRYPGYF